MTPTPNQLRQTQRARIAIIQALQNIFKNQWQYNQARRHANEHEHDTEITRIAAILDCKHRLHWSPLIMKQCAISRSLNGASQRHRRRQWLILKMTDRSCVDSSKSSEIVFSFHIRPIRRLRLSETTYLSRAASTNFHEESISRAQIHS